MRKQLYVVANQNAGTQKISLDMLRAYLAENNITFDIIQVKDPKEAYKRASGIERDQYDALAVFGGDGTAVPVVRAAIEKDMRVLLIPAGSANVIAKSAGIELDGEKVIRSFARQAYVVRHMPVARTDKGLLAVDLHYGFLAEAVLTTPQRVKRWIGESAYVVNSLLRTPFATKEPYELLVDGKVIKRDAYACFVLNVGNIRVFGVNIFPAYKPGYVRVVLVHSTDILTGLVWYLMRLLTGRQYINVVSAWHAKKVTIVRSPDMFYYDDQQQSVALPFSIEAGAYDAKIIVPVIQRRGITRLPMKLKVSYYRLTDQLRRHYTGVPSERFSRISQHLYLGGQYGPKGIEAFRERGITGIVSMRSVEPKKLGEDTHIQILHLPTTDMTPPSIENFVKGVAFIRQQVEKGGAAYVHCRLGEGRGPSMAAAYLISQGMSADDAVAHLRQYRPFVRPNKKQMERLYEFERHIRVPES